MSQISNALMGVASNRQVMRIAFMLTIFLILATIGTAEVQAINTCSGLGGEPECIRP